MARSFEQHLTDMVEVEDLPGGVSLLTFAWETRDAGGFQEVPDMIYARTSDVERVIAEAQAAGGKIVEALADRKRVTRWQVLRRGEGIPDILNAVPWEIVQQQTWRTAGGLPTVFATAAEVGRDVDPADLYSFGDRDGGTLYSFTRDIPVTRPLLTEGASALYYHLDILAPLLEAHPWVKAVYYERGRPSGDVHIAAELQVVVRLPQEQYVQHITEVGYTSGYNVGEALFLALVGQTPYTALGPDPLGIASARREGNYPYPSDDDWDMGPTYPELEDRLGTLAAAYY